MSRDEFGGIRASVEPDEPRAEGYEVKVASGRWLRLRSGLDAQETSLASAAGGTRMLNIGGATRNYLAASGIDLRKSFEEPRGLVREKLRRFVFGHVFLFSNPNRTRFKGIRPVSPTDRERQ